jgi:2-hydroxychromene-2-carboxylate isomerase
MAGSSTADALEGGPAFYFDLGSPEAYLAAERVLTVMPVAVEWVPVLARDLPAAESWEAFRCCDEREIALSQVERSAAARGLQPLRWPDPFPFDSAFAMRVATYAKEIGRTVAFALAAFRQAFAGGRSLADPDNVLIAASACEMHPAAVMRAASLRGVEARLAEATALATRRGVRDVPCVWTGEAVFHGDAGLERGARALVAA